MKRIGKWFLKYSKWIIVILLLLLFIFLLTDVFKYEILRMDNALYKFIEPKRSDMMTLMAKIITFLCSTIFLVTALLIVILFVKNKRIVKYICFNLFIVVISNSLIKLLVSRPRPIGINLIDEYGYSFPSGHAMAAMGFYGLLVYFTYKYIDNKKRKWSIIVGLSILIILIGLSRIYLGVHYTSDVLAGFALSLAYLIVYITVMEKRKLFSKL